MRSLVEVYYEWWNISVLVIIIHEKNACLFVGSYVMSICGGEDLKFVKEHL